MLESSCQKMVICWVWRRARICIHGSRRQEGSSGWVVVATRLVFRWRRGGPPVRLPVGPLRFFTDWWPGCVKSWLKSKLSHLSQRPSHFSGCLTIKVSVSPLFVGDETTAPRTSSLYRNSGRGARRVCSRSGSRGASRGLIEFEPRWCWPQSRRRTALRMSFFRNGFRNSIPAGRRPTILRGRTRGWMVRRVRRVLRSSRSDRIR